MRHASALASLVLMAGCWGSDLSACGDSLCPIGTECVPSLELCAPPEQLVACAGQDDGAGCAFGGDFGECQSGVCFPFECGDDQVSFGEDCDGTQLESCLDFGYDWGVTTCTEACLTEPDSCELLGWTEDRVPLDDNRAMVDIQITATGDVIAATSFEVLFREAVGEWTSTPLPSGPGVIVDLSASSSSEIFAVGSGGLLAVLSDSTWSITEIAAVLPPDPDPAPAPNFVGVDDMDGIAMAVGSGGTAYRYADGAWLETETMTGTNLTDVWWAGPDDAFAVGAGGTILRYQAGIWSPMSSPVGNDLGAVVGTTAVDVYAVGATGTVLHYDGDTWSEEPTGLDLNLVAVTSTEIGTFAASFGDGIVLKREGNHWAVSLNAPLSFTGLSAGGDSVLGCDISGTVVSYGGAAWEQVKSGPLFADAWMSPSGTTYVAAAPVSIGTSGMFVSMGTDVDLMKDMMDMPDLDAANRVWGRDDSDVYALTRVRRMGVVDSRITRYDGSEWLNSPQIELADLSLHDLDGSPAHLYVVGEAGHFSTLSAQGTVATTIDTPWATALNAVWAAGDDDVFVAGEAGAFGHYDGTGSVEEIETPEPIDIRAVWGTDAGNVFLAGADSTLWHYDGSSVQVVNLPVRRNQIGTEVLRSIAGTASDDVFVGGDRGSLYHFDGVTWSQIRSEAPSISALFATPTSILVAGGGQLGGHFYRLLRGRL